MVPDSVTNLMVERPPSQPDAAAGFLLDGYPRKTEQAVELDAMLTALGSHLDVAVELTADFDVVTERLLKRAQIEGRADDTEDVIRASRSTHSPPRRSPRFTRAAGCWCRWMVSAKSTRSPSASSPRSP